MRGAIDWSYDLLKNEEKRLLRFAGVHSGGFSAEALEWLNENQPETATSTLNTLMALSDKNLVRLEKKSIKPAELRFGLLEAVREYAVEQLEKQGEMAEARRRHTLYYSELAWQAEQHFTGPQYPQWGADQIGWMDRLERELDNVRVALGWYQLQIEAVPQNPPLIDPAATRQRWENLEKGLRLAASLRRVWMARGLFTEGMQRLQSLLAKVPIPYRRKYPGYERPMPGPWH